MTSPAPAEPKRTSPRRKDAIIAAFATVLAAVILASGTIIAAGKRDRDSLRDELETLRQEINTKSSRVNQLEKQLKERNSRVSQVDTIGTVTDTASTDTASTEATGVQPWPETPIAHADTEGFGIDFFGCTRTSGNVECRFKVLNTREERDFRLLAANYNSGSTNSRGIDPAGQQIAAQRGTLGGGDERADPEITIPGGITIRGTIILPDVSATMSEYAVFQLGFDSRERHRVEFRHVKLM